MTKSDHFPHYTLWYFKNVDAGGSFRLQFVCCIWQTQTSEAKYCEYCASIACRRRVKNGTRGYYIYQYQYLAWTLSFTSWRANTRLWYISDMLTFTAFLLFDSLPDCWWTTLVIGFSSDRLTASTIRTRTRWRCARLCARCTARARRSRQDSKLVSPSLKTVADTKEKMPAVVMLSMSHLDVDYIINYS